MGQNSPNTKFKFPLGLQIHGASSTEHAQRMAEAAGLAIGTVALASLFQTCLDFLEYIEDARSIKSDRERGETKLGLLKMRLKHWGGTLQVTTPGHEHGGLREHWSEENGTIENCLAGIAGILKDASTLIYGYTPCKATPLSILSELDFFVEDYKAIENLPPRHITTNGFTTFKHRIVWALKDKKRLNTLIIELDFFVTNLEKVTKRVTNFGSPTFERLCDNDKCTSMNKVHTLSDLQKTSGHPETSLQMGPVESSDSTVRDGHKFSENQAAGKGMQQMGDLGNVAEKGKKHEFEKQKAEGESKQWMGNTSEASAKLLIEKAFGK